MQEVQKPTPSLGLQPPRTRLLMGGTVPKRTVSLTGITATTHTVVDDGRDQCQKEPTPPLGLQPPRTLLLMMGVISAKKNRLPH